MIHKNKEEFYFVLRHGFNLADKKIMDLLKRKLEEDNKDTDLDKYHINLGRKDKEIRDMKSRIKEELFEVLTPNERKNFDIDQALKRINEAMGRRE